MRKKKGTFAQKPQTGSPVPTELSKWPPSFWEDFDLMMCSNHI